MIALLLAANLLLRAPGTPLPDSITCCPGDCCPPRTLDIYLERRTQSRTWALGLLRHSAPAWWWQLVWPIVRREALAPQGTWTRPAYPGEWIAFGDSIHSFSEPLPSGFYTATACWRRKMLCGPPSRIWTVP